MDEWMVGRWMDGWMDGDRVGEWRGEWMGGREEGGCEIEKKKKMKR